MTKELELRSCERCGDAIVSAPWTATTGAMWLCAACAKVPLTLSQLGLSHLAQPEPPRLGVSEIRRRADAFLEDARRQEKPQATDAETLRALIDLKKAKLGVCCEMDPKEKARLSRAIKKIGTSLINGVLGDE